MVARLHHKIAGVLVIVPLLLFVLTTNQEDVVSAFIATTTNRRTPAPALIVVRDPSTVPAIDWDIFEMEEQRAFDSATIIAPRPKYIPDFDVVSETYSPLQVTTPDTIEVPPDDPDAWKGSLIMAAGLMATHHDIPAMMLLLSTAATGEFGTAVRLTSRCAWRSFDVCKVLSMEGFQSVTDLLKDVGVMEQEKGRENWVMSWAKRSWNDAVKQERQWAESMRSFFVPDETETSTLSDLKKSVMTDPVIQPEETKPELVQTYAGTLLREEGVLVLPIIEPTDPTSLSGKQRVRDLMRQQRELHQDRTVVSDLQVNIVAEESNVVPPDLHIMESIVAEELSNTNPPAIPVVNTAAATRQRVRDLMRQQREGGSASSIHRDRQETTPSLFATGGMTTTATLRQSSAKNSAADSRQRVRDLMRQRGKQDMTPVTVASTITADKITNTNTPSLFTSPGLTTTAANFQSVTERAAGSRQRVRDLMRQKQEQDGRIERSFTTTVPQMCLAPAASAGPAETVSITAMEERFRKQRVLNAVVRNKIRGMMIQKSIVDVGKRKGTTNAKEEEEKTHQEEILRPVSASGGSPLTMTEKKTLNQARMALATSKMAEQVLVTTGFEPKPNHQRKSWRYRIAEWLNGASPQGWATAW